MDFQKRLIANGSKFNVIPNYERTNYNPVTYQRLQSQLTSSFDFIERKEEIKTKLEEEIKTDEYMRHE